MARRDGMREKKCGCVVFDHGPPILCVTHQTKIERKVEREKAQEEKGIRKAAHEAARRLGHDLSRFKETKATRGKWVAFCRSCGALVIVYDEIPRSGCDQISGKPISEGCRGGSVLLETLGSSDVPMMLEDTD